MRSGYRAHPEQRRPQGTVCCHKHGRVLDLLCKGKQLLAERVRRPKVGAHVIIIPQSTQHGEKLVGIVEVVTELSSTRVGLCHLRSPIAFRGGERCPQGNVYSHFLLEPLRRLW